MDKPELPVRDYSPLDNVLGTLSRGLALLAAPAAAPQRASPAAQQPKVTLAPEQHRHVAGLMRINHAGEIAAQALYHGQALTARDPQTREQLLAAAREERDHLQWCEERLHELGDGPSRLQPLWYAGSLAIGAVAGLSGDRYSLGFVRETERQVAEHIGEHLRQLPEHDGRDRAILEAMRADEQRHGDEAGAAGAAELPTPVRDLMRQVAKIMKFGAYRV